MRRPSTYIHPLITSVLLAAGLPLQAQTLSRGSQEYNMDFSGYTFSHTRGFPDTPHMMDWPSKYEDPDKWEFLTDEEKDRLKALGIDIKLPYFSFMTPADSKYPLSEGQVRQRTHTVEHILYAMPGDLVPMYPYYGLSNKDLPDYEDKFSHWYDFTDGGCLTYELDGRTYDLIDFLDDRQHMHRNAKCGFFGGESLNTITNEWKRIPGTFANFYCPPTADGRLPFKNGRKEFVIAADFSQTFSISQHIDNENSVITEPLIAFRHIFRIRDAREFAEEFSGSVEKNRSFINKRQRMVTAPAGRFFQMRLESPLPQDYRLGQSIYYFKRQDGTYGRVCGHDVRVIDGDTGETIGNPGFSVWDREDRRVAVKRGYAVREADGGYYTGKADPDFVNYVTMLYNSTAPAGHYIVQFLGKDENDNLIKLRDSEGKESDLVIMEYNVTFLPEEGASVVTEETLYGQKKFEHARDEKLKEEYGQPADVIDFDEYIKINRLTDEDKALKEKLISYTRYERKKGDPDVPDDAAVYAGKFTEPTKNGKEHSFYKWPVPWDQSNYSFGYRYRHDYSMYMLATHSGNVPYSSAASLWPESSNMAGDGAGLYDRLYYKTKRQSGAADPSKVEQGYFYYVNAASDPGVSARLNINITCPGSRIVVSAWMAEFSSSDETANISFNFVAVMKDTGERIVLHNFITGYVSPDDRGKWLNVYYSFVPRLAEFTAEEGNLFDLVDHYELELDNNTTSSAGADYAIDDIRAYVVPPMAEAEQLTLACDNDEIRLRLGGPFETLIEKIGKAETIGNEPGDEVELYYAFIDKAKFDLLYKNGEGSLEAAYDAAVVRKKLADGSFRSYGKVTFKTNYLKNEDFKVTDDIVEDKAYRFTDESGERMVIFEHTAQLSNLRAGREYYVVFRSSLGEGDTPDAAGSEASFFDVADDCANKCVSVIRPANTIKVDGEVRNDIGRILVCENQSPVIQVNIAGRFEDGSIKEVEKNARFDWFYGTLEEFEAYADENGNKLKEALEVFRARYPYAESALGVKADETKPEGKERLEQWMLDIIIKASTPLENSPIPALTMYQASFVLPPVELPEGTTEAANHAVAIPIPDNGPDKDFILCTSPTEIDVTVGNRTPLLRHGLNGITYPAALSDVPLRIGLGQLRNGLDAPFAMKSLTIPVREVASAGAADPSSVEMKILKEGYVTLVQTNDPDYKDLGTIDETDKEIESLLWVGEIKELQAKAAPGYSASNSFKVEFKNDFGFKEGYFYRFRFRFEENPVETDPSVTVCSGEDVFTLKIVPEYLLWTGADGLNWNNDANWSRLDQDEIYSDKKDSDHRHFVIDGLNDRKSAYAPLDFTKVVIAGADPETPWLYGSATQDVKDFHNPSAAFKWAGSITATDADAASYPDFPANISLLAPTALIQYDMAAFYPASLNDGKTPATAETTELMNVGCRPWYANTCGEIHFKPGGTIMNQQHLGYIKAWVDVELDPSRWYTLSLPLKEVFAGDLYLPSDNARQSTELFSGITFDNELKLNHRFKPAVYQRGWDKSEARVYELENKTGAPRNVAVRTFWSHVYNDVVERYGAGTGFSIKTDVSALGKEWTDDDRVLFRLPKADGKYLYFNQDGTKNGHETTITRTESHYRLNDAQGMITAYTNEAGKYFLVGNPFMTHLDIRAFLKANESKVEQKYWVITESGQQAVVFTEDGTITAEADGSESADLTVVAPMQGFFVEAKAPATELNLDYKPSMMRRYDLPSKQPLTLTTRSSSTTALKVTALCEGRPASAATIVLGDDDSAEAVAIDNRELDIPSVVYTVKNGTALSINSTSSMEMTEIGVIADPDTESVIRFSGESAAEGLYLLDKSSDRFIPIHNGLELKAKGSVAGRWFITSTASKEELTGGVEWYTADSELNVVDNLSTGTLDVKVFDLLGRPINHITGAGDTVSIPLQSGIYLIEITTSTTHISEKIRI